MLLPAAMGEKLRPRRTAEAPRCALPIVLVVAASRAPFAVEAQSATRDEQRARVAFEAGRRAFRYDRGAVLAIVREAASRVLWGAVRAVRTSGRCARIWPRVDDGGEHGAGAIGGGRD
jgi:hypothetical protein